MEKKDAAFERAKDKAIEEFKLGNISKAMEFYNIDGSYKDHPWIEAEKSKFKSIDDLNLMIAKRDKEIIELKAQVKILMRVIKGS